ncbi:MAG: dihydroneopterin aldolase [Bacteroidota bacterium]|jgi:dihydroneopterin aldolase
MFAKVKFKPTLYAKMDSLASELSIDNIKVKAHHGWYEAERKVGGMYSVSVKVFSKVNTNDDFSDLDSSVNYEKVYASVIDIMDKEFKLIEECCKALFDAVKQLKPNSVWEVLLVKENPPLKYVGATSFKLKG